jgi:2-(1,2-epoxy-1,2-dihydrophenyl)acetyl-CoA isomerase
MEKNMRTYETIKIDIHDGYVELILNRPEMLNALDQQVAEELCDLFDRMREDGEERALLLRGEGRAFSAGGNLKDMERSLVGNPAEFFEEPLKKIHEAALSLASLPLPVVGAVHGFVSGAGFNLALCCDLLLCSSETRFNQAFVRIGAVPDTGGTFFLPRLVGVARAMELFMLGDFVDAERAFAIGIVNRVIPADDLLTEARELARRLATGPTKAYAEIKQLVLGAATATLSEALDAEREAQLRIAATEDFKEGVRSFFHKRDPSYQGR